MQKECKQCKSNKVVKNGKQDSIQRYKCKDCGCVFRESEPKYSPEFKLDAVMMHLNSVGFRAIGRIKNVHNSLVSYWVKKAGIIAKENFYQQLEKIESKDIQILEIDELFTYVKKKKIKRIYSLLLTEDRVELLISK